MNLQTPLSDDQLYHTAPSIMARIPAEDLSDKYTQVPTISIVNLMRTQGWMPVRARQCVTKSIERRPYCKHEIRFQQVNDVRLSKVGDETIQAVMTNSHDGQACFRFMLGVFRLACTNGMVVANGMFNEIKIRHIGFQASAIDDLVTRIAEGGTQVIGRIEAMKATLLNEDEQQAFARAAVQLIAPNDQVLIPLDGLLAARRREDSGSDLWRTFNRLQENSTRGGLKYLSPPKNTVAGQVTPVSELRRNTTRPIKSIDRDIKLNQALWSLAEEMLRLKGNA